MIKTYYNTFMYFWGICSFWVFYSYLLASDFMSAPFNKRLLISLMLIGLTTGVESQTLVTKIAPGDFILVKGKVMHCDDWGEFMIEYGQVFGHEVKLFHHKLITVGLSPAEFEVSLKEAIYVDTNHWPLLSIQIFSAGEFNLNRDEIEKEISLYYEAINTCDKKVEKFKKRSKSVAMYYEMFKYVPSAGWRHRGAFLAFNSIVISSSERI